MESVGLVKFDFLGLRTLTILDWALVNINAKRKALGEEPLDIEKIPLDDTYTFTETGIPVLTEAALQSYSAPPSSKEQQSLELEQKIQDLTLQLNTLMTEKEETLTLQSYVHQQQLDILQTQNMKLIEQHKGLKAQYDTQQERFDALSGQVISLSGIEDSLRQERTIHQKQLQELQLSLSAAGEQQQQIAKLLANKDQEYQRRNS